MKAEIKDFEKVSFGKKIKLNGGTRIKQSAQKIQDGFNKVKELLIIYHQKHIELYEKKITKQIAKLEKNESKGDNKTIEKLKEEIDKCKNAIEEHKRKINRIANGNYELITKDIKKYRIERAIQKVNDDMEKMKSYYDQKDVALKFGDKKINLGVFSSGVEIDDLQEVFELEEANRYIRQARKIEAEGIVLHGEDFIRYISSLEDVDKKILLDIVNKLRVYVDEGLPEYAKKQYNESSIQERVEFLKKCCNNMDGLKRMYSEAKTVIEQERQVIEYGEAFYRGISHIREPQQRNDIVERIVEENDTLNANDGGDEKVEIPKVYTKKLNR